jgi:hypothetical protein
MERAMTRMTRVKPNLPLHAMAFALAAVGPFLMIGGLVAHAWIAACVGAALVFLGRLPWLYVTERHALASRVPALVDASESGLVLDGKQRIAASEITEAVMWPNAGRKPTVRVKTGRGLPAVELEVETWDEGQTLLHAIGFDAARRPASFTTLVPKLMTWGQLAVFMLPVAAMGILLALGHRADGPELAAWCFSSLAAGVAAIRIPRRIDVRPDALVIRFMRREERIPWADVESIKRSFNSGTITLKSGRTIELRGGMPGTVLPEGQRSDDALTERAAEAHAALTGPIDKPRPAQTSIAKLPESVTVLRARVWAFVAMIAMFASSFGAIYFGRHQPWMPWVAGSGILGALAFQMFAALRPNRLVPARVEQRPEGVAIAERVIVRETIENAYVQPAFTGAPFMQAIYKTHPRVVFVGRKRRDSIEVLVENEAEGNALLQALALDPAHAVATFTARSGMTDNTAAQVVLFAMLVGGWRLIPHTHGAARYALIAATILAFVNATWPTKIRVGADGILVRTLRKKTFYAYADIESVDASGKGVVLVMRSGTRVPIPTVAVGTSASHSLTRDSLLKRISDGLAAARGGKGDLGRVLSRDGRTAHDWLVALRALGAGQSSGYRVASVDEERLWSVVEDASAKPEARASAAAALRVKGDAPVARLRATAQATASPKLRVALEAAASDDDAQLERALAECEEDEEEAAAR